MRVTGGEARGRVIKAPPGLAVRPTASKVRQAFFNILQDRIDGADFLDVFAGSGLMGIEALSRGARSLVAVDENRQNARAIEAALKELHYEGRVISCDFRKALSEFRDRSFDVIFADPPYKSSLATTVVELCGRQELLRDNGLLIVEHARSYEMPVETNGLIRRNFKAYGQTGLSFFARSGGAI
ncbi:MAG TPA: 16S rRNA (guanine(966)-N(2))-methyltransferase RsmD [Chroococcales cyanobacterium]